MNPACPACNSTIDLPTDLGPLVGKTIGCPHCGAVLRVGLRWPDKERTSDLSLRLLTLAEAADAHHEVLGRLFLSRAGLRSEPAWSADALALLLTLHGHLAAFAEAKTLKHNRGVEALLEAGDALAGAELAGAIERILQASELPITYPTKDATDDRA